MVGYYKNQEQRRKYSRRTAGYAPVISVPWTATEIFSSGDALKTMILSSSGQNIFPEEIEAKLNNLPFILESLVIERNKKLVALSTPIMKLWTL